MKKLAMIPTVLYFGGIHITVSFFYSSVAFIVNSANVSASLVKSKERSVMNFLCRLPQLRKSLLLCLFYKENKYVPHEIINTICFFLANALYAEMGRRCGSVSN